MHRSADDRRSDDRFAVQRPAVLRLITGDVTCVCTSISMGGGFVACNAAVELGQVVPLAVQPGRFSRPDIERAASVLYVVRPGGVQAQGLGLRWVPGQDLGQLAILVGWASNMARQGMLDDPHAKRDTLMDLTEEQTAALAATAPVPAVSSDGLPGQG